MEKSNISKRLLENIFHFGIFVLITKHIVGLNGTQMNSYACLLLPRHFFLEIDPTMSLKISTMSQTVTGFFCQQLIHLDFWWFKVFWRIKVQPIFRSLLFLGVKQWPGNTTFICFVVFGCLFKNGREFRFSHCLCLGRNGPSYKKLSRSRLVKILCVSCLVPGLCQ